MVFVFFSLNSLILTHALQLKSSSRRAAGDCTLQEGRADDTAQAIYHPFLHSLLLCRTVPQGRLLFPQSLKMQEESTLKQMLLNF